MTSSSETGTSRKEASTEQGWPADAILKRHIRYLDDDDIEAQDGRGPGPSHGRTGRRDSSVSMRSGRESREIDPRHGIPITYRTVSFNIANSQERATFEAHKKKKELSDVIGERDWHLISTQEVYKRQCVDPTTGLTCAAVKEKNSKYGRNVHSPPPSHLLQRLFWYFFGGFGSILFGGAILVFISWKPLGQPPQVANLVLALVLVGVWLCQAVFNLWQDFSSSRVMKSITGMLPEDCLVLRDGSKQSIPAADIVPGDIIYFRAGNKVPADMRFTEVTGDAKFDRGILTGESINVAAVVNSNEENYLETKCMGLQGTHCTSGSGAGVVVSIGEDTVFGQIAKASAETPTTSTYLQKEVIRFVFIIAGLMVVMSLVIIGIWAGYIRHHHPDFMPPSALIVSIVSVAIAFIPEGLPFAVTASLTIVANTMKRHNIICKSLKTVETLGCVSVLLSDKTGTLTKNQMTVTDCMVGHATLTTSIAGKEVRDAGRRQASLHQLRIIGALCNAAEFDASTVQKSLSERKIFGDATDQAILRFSEMLGSHVQARGLWKKHFELPFNSKNKFLLTILSSADEEAIQFTLSKDEARNFEPQKDSLLMIKGAPDILLPRCSQYITEDGNIASLDGDIISKVGLVKDQWSKEGKRVILLARRCLPATDITISREDGNYETLAMKQASEGLVLTGLVAMSDPPRDEIPEVIATLRGAGVRTMMVTGDFKLTAQSIARSCGIITCSDSNVDSVNDLPRHSHAQNSVGKRSEKNLVVSGETSRAIVISGAELPSLSEYQWQSILEYPAVVFARTTPDQKLLIVQRFRAAGFVTAMTGDGVNDAPSLREADIGIAPGSGSDIALEAADMILLTSFSSIIPALAYGRSVFSNLRKTIAYLLPAGSYSEFWPVMTSVAFGLPQILSSFMMIIICCCTDCGAACALAYEKPEADLLTRPPRDVKKDRLVDWKLLAQAYLYTGTLESLISFAMSYWYLQQKGVKFSMLWFSYGKFTPPPGKDLDWVNNQLLIGSGVYFVTLVVLQWFNLMGVRTRCLSLFQHPPIGKRETQNYLLFPSILFALAIALIFVYIQGVHSVAGSGSVPVQYWFIPMAIGLGMLCLEELRKLCLCAVNYGGPWILNEQRTRE